MSIFKKSYNLWENFPFNVFGQKRETPQFTYTTSFPLTSGGQTLNVAVHGYVYGDGIIMLELRNSAGGVIAADDSISFTIPGLTRLDDFGGNHFDIATLRRAATSSVLGCVLRVDGTDTVNLQYLIQSGWNGSPVSGRIIFRGNYSGPTGELAIS